MAVDMKVNMSTIRNKVMANLLGRMGEVIGGNGKMANKMGKDIIEIKMVLKKREFGVMEKKSNGWTDIINIYSILLKINVWHFSKSLIKLNHCIIALRLSMTSLMLGRLSPY